MERDIENRAEPQGKLVAPDSFFNALRRYTRNYHLTSVVRTLRTMIHFGPWRVVPRFLIRQLRPALPAERDGNGRSLLDSLDANVVADRVRRNSVAIAGVLPADFVHRLRAVTDHLPVDHYQMMHHIDEDVRRLSEDPAIKNVLRAYFKSEPVLLESTLLITELHKTSEEANSFHFDFAGWESLNVFVYLNDVNAESSCHIVAKGSHRKVGVRDVIRKTLPDDEALRRFGPSIEVITGPAGTLFFENTEAFHRRHPGPERRVMLNLLFASHRSWFSHGRASSDEIRYRARAYERLQNAG